MILGESREQLDMLVISSVWKLQVCTKDNDAVKIHSAATENTGPADYFYNYFHLGVDVLFDGRSHMMKKVILHTNHPTHELFSQYARCFFQVPIAPSDAGKMPDASVGALSQAPHGHRDAGASRWKR